MPLEAIRQSLIQLGLDESWGEHWSIVKLLSEQVSKNEMSTQIKFLKVFEQFFEAVPQFALSALYLGIHHKEMTYEQRGWTIASLVLSSGSIVYGIITSLTAAKDVYQQGLQSKDGVTQLHIAARDGKEAEVESQIRTGADVDQGDVKGKTALHYAAENGRFNVATTLLREKADINAQTEEGKSPTDLASDPQVKGLLLAKGAACI